MPVSDQITKLFIDRPKAEFVQAPAQQFLDKKTSPTQPDATADITEILAKAKADELESAWKTRELNRRDANMFVLRAGMGRTARGTMEAVGTDGKYWFTKLYEFITSFEIAKANQFTFPDFVMHFIPAFYDLYHQPLMLRVLGRSSQVTSLWNEHFDVTDKKPDSGWLYVEWISECIRTGVTAHVQGDMANALVTAFTSFRTKYDLSKDIFPLLKHDFFGKISKEIFYSAKDEFLKELSRQAVPLGVQAGGQLLGVGDYFMGLSIDEIFSWREKAWTDAEADLRSQ